MQIIHIFFPLILFPSLSSIKLNDNNMTRSYYDLLTTEKRLFTKAIELRTTEHFFPVFVFYVFIHKNGKKKKKKNKNK